MKLVMLLAGVLILLLGVHWIGQGTGYSMWPENPVMDNHIAWAGYGMGAVAAGALLVWFSRRKSR